jgi:hypothetical protein
LNPPATRVCGVEQSLSYGRKCPVQALFIAPLFEEHNRCRRLLVEIMRGLERKGVGSTLPDLPGTGESLIDISDISLEDWRDAVDVTSAATSPTLIVSFRGGALIDGVNHAKGWWRCAPETGARIARDLRRTRLDAVTDDPPLYGGNPISDTFLTALESATPAGVTPLRTVRLASDTADADAKFPGIPLWRRAEPGEDPELAQALASDIASWARLCAAS